MPVMRRVTYGKSGNDRQTLSFHVCHRECYDELVAPRLDPATRSVMASALRKLFQIECGRQVEGTRDELLPRYTGNRR